MTKKDKDPKWKIFIEMWFWGVYFWWRDLFATKRFPDSAHLMEMLGKRFSIPEIDWQKTLLRMLVNLTSFTILFLLVALIIGIIQAFTLGVRSDATREEHRYIAPTAVIIDVQRENEFDWWDVKVKEWLRPSQSLTLREQVNVTNLIILNPDEVKISSNQTLYKDSSWKQERPYFVEALSTEDTSIVVQMGGIQYHLNMYMPFVWKSAPNMVVLVDESGMLWVKQTQDIILEAVGSKNLPIEIAPNPYLEISFSKQQ